MSNTFVNKSSQAHQVWVLAALFLFLCLFEWVGLYEVVRGPLEQALAPLMAVQYRVTSVLTWPIKRVVVSYDRAERIRDLEVKYSKALTQLVDLERLQKENQELQELLNTQRVTYGVITAPILSLSHPAIQAGQNQGIEIGDMVVIDATLVGVVTKVSKEQSQITLLTNPTTAPILAKTDSGVRGIVVGDGKNVTLKELPRDVVIQPGEKVTTIGQAGIEPNIFIGTVRSVDAQPESPVQTAVVEQLVSFYDAVLVEVY